jgi:hypothetical protein
MASEPRLSIQDEILKIRKASAARDPWAVLAIPQRSDYHQIKSAQRKWIRRLHPDRWYAAADKQLRNEIQEAFYQVQAAYFETLKHCATTIQQTTASQSSIAPEPVLNGPVQKGIYVWFRRLLSFWFTSDGHPDNLA